LSKLPAMPIQHTQLSVQPIFTSTELILPEDTTFEDWTAIGRRLQWISRGIHFWIGDWLRFGERKWGERYAQALDETPFAYQTLANDVWVCKRIPQNSRRAELSFGHHSVVAALPPDERDMWLDKAEKEGWTRRQLWAESRNVPEKLVPLYDGVGELFYFDTFNRWMVRLPPGMKLEAEAGDQVHIVIKEKHDRPV